MTIDYDFYLDGSKHRFDYTARLPSGLAGADLTGGRRIHAFDGQERRGLTILSKHLSPVHYGLTNTSQPHFDVGIFALKPLFCAFRMLDDELSALQLDKFTLLQRQLSLDDGHRCVILTLNEQGQAISAWLDIEEGFSLRRYVVDDRASGETTLQLDIVNASFPEVGWLPHEWHAIWSRPNAPVKRTDAVMTKVEMNPEFATNIFAFAFPNETFVVGQNDDGERTSYLIEADGRSREVTQNERLSLTIDQIASNEPVKGPERRYLRRLWLVLWLNLAAGLVIAAYVLFRKWRARRA